MNYYKTIFVDVISFYYLICRYLFDSYFFVLNDSPVVPVSRKYNLEICLCP
jgi:hypothetical protein